LRRRQTTAPRICVPPDPCGEVVAMVCEEAIGPGDDDGRGLSRAAVHRTSSPDGWWRRDVGRCSDSLPGRRSASPCLRVVRVARVDGRNRCAPETGSRSCPKWPCPTPASPGDPNAPPSILKLHATGGTRPGHCRRKAHCLSVDRRIQAGTYPHRRTAMRRNRRRWNAVRDDHLN